MIAYTDEIAAVILATLLGLPGHRRQAADAVRPSSSGPLRPVVLRQRNSGRLRFLQRRQQGIIK